MALRKPEPESPPSHLRQLIGIAEISTYVNDDRHITELFPYKISGCRQCIHIPADISTHLATYYLNNALLGGDQPFTVHNLDYLEGVDNEGESFISVSKLSFQSILRHAQIIGIYLHNIAGTNGPSITLPEKLKVPTKYGNKRRCPAWLFHLGLSSTSGDNFMIVLAGSNYGQFHKEPLVALLTITREICLPIFTSKGIQISGNV